MKTEPTPEAPARSAGRRQVDHRRRLLDRLLTPIIVCLIVLGVIDTVLSVAVFSQQGRTNTAALTAKNAATKARAAAADLAAQQRRTASAIHGSCERLQIARDDLNAVSGLIYGTAVRFHLPPLTRVRYLPPTDCAAAVLRPATYRPPLPVPFRAIARCYDPVRHPRPTLPCPTR